MESVISIKDLSKSFGENKAVDHLELEVFKGDVFGFLGPNGAGKSTTIRMLLTLIEPDAGTIKIFNSDLKTERKNILRRIGCIVEKPDFYTFLSAAKNLEVLSMYNGIAITKNKIEEMLDFVGLHGRGKDKVSGYSHGMKQRLGLAQALLHDPELIILDEPTTGLDPQGIIDIRELILHLSKDKGKTIFLSSHILNELELISNRIAILNKGKLVVQGDMKELLNDRKRIVQITTDRPIDAYALLMNSPFKEDATGYSDTGVQLSLLIHQIPAIIEFLVQSNFSVYGVESRRQLEDLFLKLTESAEKMNVKG
ncbi:MAG: ABC transporter ATP-binding protein [Bacteroidetes bacterium]|nr:ABC transporter ATP-binding protein [Bacteroidota bacterium]